MNDALIIGAGPAGVSCAIWLKQLGFNPVLVDKSPTCGGLQLSNPYTNTWIATSADVYGPDVARAMQDNITRHKVQTRLQKEALLVTVENESLTVMISGGESISARYLVLASGVTPKDGGLGGRLGIIVGPGPAVAKSDFTNTRVAILGGGDSAFENHGFVMERGAISATIFARTLRARVEMLDRVAPQDVVVGDYTVDKDAKRVNGQSFDQILVLYGYGAAPQSLLGLDIAMRTDGFVWTNEECVTSLERVYAVGELARRGHPCCVTAMADGVVAAKSIQRRLESTKLSKYAGIARRAMSFGAKVLL